jgi:hypothetical protein
MAWREGFSGGGQQLATGIGTLVAGVMIVAASVYFNTLGADAAALVNTP